MIKEGKFGVQEAVCLASIAISSKIFFSSPGYLTRFVGAAGWYMTIISCVTAIIAFKLIMMLFKQFPGKNIIDIFELTLGRGTGFFFSISFVAFFLYSDGILIREFIGVTKTFILTDTPLSVLAVLFVAVVMVVAVLGLESIARVAKFFAYTLLFFFVFVILLCVQNYQVTNLFPVGGYGIDKTLIHGLKRCSAYDEVMILTVFAGSLQGTKYLKKAGCISLFISGAIISIGLFCFSLAFPVQVLQELTSPMFTMARSISYGAFLQRLDPIFVFMWTISTLITGAIFFYSSVSCYCKIFRIRDTKPVILPMGILLFLIVMMPKSLLSVISGGVQTLRGYGWVVLFVLPIICLFVNAFKKETS
ncbi:MAG: spore gernimation protein [Firmicutes bacterium HGW-Firmicutes-16]|nr:MAG: spore gernimation protein [Firmicutes bacterium HGW-Firmicutes-16]